MTRRPSILFAVLGLSILAGTFAVACDFLWSQNAALRRRLDVVGRELRWKSYALIKAESKIQQLPKMQFLVHVMAVQNKFYYDIAESVWAHARVLEKWDQIVNGPALVMSLVYRESNFDPFAQSYRTVYNHDGGERKIPIASGPAQINFKVWQKKFNLDQKKIFDPDYNIRHAVQIFDGYMADCRGDVSCALFKYWGGDPARHGYGYPQRVLESKFYEVIK